MIERPFQEGLMTGVKQFDCNQVPLVLLKIPSDAEFQQQRQIDLEFT
jgi:hypothetical protein